VFQIKQTSTFRRWLSRIRDKRAKTIIAAKLLRLLHGMPNDIKPVGQGIFELRIHYGPGYRIYFQTRASSIILLRGGIKDSQLLDIIIAKELAKRWNDDRDE